MFFGVFILIPLYLNHREDVEYHRMKAKIHSDYIKLFEVAEPVPLPPMWYDYSQLLEKPEQEGRADPFWDGMMWADLD
jgi:hypothetical protein